MRGNARILKVGEASAISTPVREISLKEQGIRGINIDTLMIINNIESKMYYVSKLQMGIYI